MTLNERIGILANLGTALIENNDARKFAVAKAYYENKWFTEDEVNRMLSAITDHYLDYDALAKFVGHYDLDQELGDVKTIGLIPAGNIPLVAFHDILCILLSGHQAQVKMSDKDKNLLPWIMQVLEGISLEMARQVQFVEKLSGFDAVIATGSNNSAETFKRYFGKYPHIIRNNKTGIAVLSGEETNEELTDLAEDVFSYYGLGCRNISKIYVPTEYDFNPLCEVLNTYKEIVLHSKYKNNFDYNLAIAMLNKDAHINVASIILIEKAEIHSRIASLHYEFYDKLSAVASDLKSKQENIQVITTNLPLDNLETKALGMAQKPMLEDYADGIDSMKFLKSL